MKTFFCLLIVLLSTTQVKADLVHVAVASNFTHAIKALADQFNNETGHDVIISQGSTGKLYAQIKHGAPYDVFFAADRKRPEKLETEGNAIQDSRFTYAIGKLVLWSPLPDLVDSKGNVLKQDDFVHLAIANPKLAPYGKAAQQVLQEKGLWEQLQSRLVRGENINQAFQFVKSGNAQLGFVALSQVQYTGHYETGSFWEIPQSLYTPIEQQAVLLRQKQVANDFLMYVKNKKSREIIRSYGYGTF